MYMNIREHKEYKMLRTLLNNDLKHKQNMSLPLFLQKYLLNSLYKKQLLLLKKILLDNSNMKF